MSLQIYNKKNWKLGDVITKDDLNRFQNQLYTITNWGHNTVEDGMIQDLVMFSSTQPDSSYNKIWIDSSDVGVQLYTSNQIDGKIQELNEVIDNLNSLITVNATNIDTINNEESGILAQANDYTDELKKDLVAQNNFRRLKLQKCGIATRDNDSPTASNTTYIMSIYNSHIAPYPFISAPCDLKTFKYSILINKNDIPTSYSLRLRAIFYYVKDNNTYKYVNYVLYHALTRQHVFKYMNESLSSKFKDQLTDDPTGATEVFALPTFAFYEDIYNTNPSILISLSDEIFNELVNCKQFIVPRNQIQQNIENLTTTIYNNLNDDNSISNIKNNNNEYTSNFIPFTYPNNESENGSLKFNGTFKPVTIFTDGKHYITDFNADNFKVLSTNTIYVSAGASSGDGTKDNPKRLADAINSANNGDTIICLAGIYTDADTDGLTNYKITKSLNIIGQGKVQWVIGGQIKTSDNWTWQSSKSLWRTAMTTLTYDIIDEQLNFRLTEITTSITDCQNTLGSWFYSSSSNYLYINSKEKPNVFLITQTIFPTIELSDGNNIYFENITFIGGKRNMYIKNNINSTAVFNKCNFLFALGDNSSTSVAAVETTGSTVLFNKCRTAYCSYGDGFSYKSSSNFVEIDCIGDNNGLNKLSAGNMNGTTAHTSSKGIRINGIYHDNAGANIADVQDDTQTLNLGCVAKNIHTIAQDKGLYANIAAQQSGTTMWVYNCETGGDGVIHDLMTANGTTMIVKNTNFRTKQSNGTFIFIKSNNEISNGENLNDYILAGQYLYDGTATTLLNAPIINVPFKLQVINNKNIIYQIAYVDNIIFMRGMRENGATYLWNNWNRIQTQSTFFRSSVYKSNSNDSIECTYENDGYSIQYFHNNGAYVIAAFELGLYNLIKNSFVSIVIENTGEQFIPFGLMLSESGGNWNYTHSTFISTISLQPGKKYTYSNTLSKMIADNDFNNKTIYLLYYSSGNDKHSETTRNLKIQIKLQPLNEFTQQASKAQLATNAESADNLSSYITSPSQIQWMQGTITNSGNNMGRLNPYSSNSVKAYVISKKPLFAGKHSIIQLDNNNGSYKLNGAKYRYNSATNSYDCYYYRSISNGSTWQIDEDCYITIGIKQIDENNQDIDQQNGDTSLSQHLILNIRQLIPGHEILNKLEVKEKYITCWGDSLTALGGWTTRLSTLTGLPVYNAGTGGEKSNTIVARQGGDVMEINNVTIPADTTPIVIAHLEPQRDNNDQLTNISDGGILTHNGETVRPLLQSGKTHINNCKLGNILGELDFVNPIYYTYPSGTTEKVGGDWTFTRAQPAQQATVINRPTVLRTNYDMNYNDPYLMIIFMGTNGGYDQDLDKLVRQHRLMIEHSKAEHTLILGLSKGSASGLADYQARMKQEFGWRFLSLRQYLAHPIYNSNNQIISCYGLEDQELDLETTVTISGSTYNTLDEITAGKVPHQILTDGTHYTEGTKTVIGNLIYKYCKQLGIFE